MVWSILNCWTCSCSFLSLPLHRLTMQLIWKSKLFQTYIGKRLWHSQYVYIYSYLSCKLFRLSFGLYMLHLFKKHLFFPWGCCTSVVISIKIFNLSGGVRSYIYTSIYESWRERVLKITLGINSELSHPTWNYKQALGGIRENVHSGRPTDESRFKSDINMVWNICFLKQVTLVWTAVLRLVQPHLKWALNCKSTCFSNDL